MDFLNVTSGEMLNIAGPQQLKTTYNLNIRYISHLTIQFQTAEVLTPF